MWRDHDVIMAVGYRSERWFYRLPYSAPAVIMPGDYYAPSGSQVPVRSIGQARPWQFIFAHPVVNIDSLKVWHDRPAGPGASRGVPPRLALPCQNVSVAEPLEPVVNALNQADSLPFLFVGSGVSRRYLGHEGWEDLLKWAATLTDKHYGYFSGKAGRNFPATASLIAKDFYEIWWTSPKYKASRDKWSDCCKDVTSPLKIEVAQRLSASKPVRKLTLTKELKLLGSCQVDGIITTNYDTLLDSIFPKYRVFVGQEDLLLSRAYQLAEIYKIHGSVVEPESLVFCKDDYDRFDEQSPYLVAKLMSVFVEHPVIFLGYSLDDMNIRTILTSLLSCLNMERLEKFKSRFVWVDWDPRRQSPRVDDHVVDLGEGRLLPVIRIRTGDFKPIFDVLAGLERVIPVGILRRLEESVVRIVHSADPRRRIHVAELQDLESFNDSDVVIGIGTHESSSCQGAKGYLGINRHDLIKDTLTDEAGWSADKIVRRTLPVVLRSSPSAWVPVRKYVSRAGLPIESVPDSVQRAMAREPITNYSLPPGSEDMSISELVTEHGLAKALNLLLAFDRSKVNVAELHQLLVENIDVLEAHDSNLKTAFAKATVLYDILADRARRFELRERLSGPPKSRTTKGSRASRTTSADRPTASEVRVWARANAREVNTRGPIPAALVADYLAYRGH